ncbi:MAG TPA: hypothetical protein VGM31_14260 [Puia sp.]|jgi:hypothetical protein
MRTTLDIVDILWSRLSESNLKDAITGGIYKHIGPVNSTKEDIVINSLPIVNLDLQTAVANVNIFVPNPTQNLNGVQDNSQPNGARLKELGAVAMEILAAQYGADYSFDVQQSVTLPDEASGSWYINIRVNFYSINLN